MEIGSKCLAGLAVGIVILIFILGYVIFILASSQYEMLIYWIPTALLMVSFLAAIGKAINYRWSGILINEMKVMSLSRFQIVIWTVIILSAFLTIASARIYAGPPPDPDPLNIAIDWQLWALLGISSTSLVSTPIIIDDKKKKSIRQDVADRNLYLSRNREGIAHKNLLDSSAKFTDMFKGDETGNKENVDMSKVQMFFFTIISALSYIVLLFHLFLGGTVPDSLPSIPPGLLAILTISHGAYLTYKIVDHTPGAIK